jgi:radical SAM superfamily enzyme YgiQ (UPF0313 family)
MCNSRIDTLPSMDTLVYMGKSGCFLIAFGVESGSLRMLEVMKKGRNKAECERYVKTIKPSIELVKKAGIFTIANMIVGFRGESIDTVLESVNLMKDCRPDFPLSFAAPIPFPGSELGKTAEDKGLFPQDGKGALFEWNTTYELCASTSDIDADMLIRFQRFTNAAVRISDFSKLILGLKLLNYFVRKGNLDVLMNATRIIFKENVGVPHILDKLNARALS